MEIFLGILVVLGALALMALTAISLNNRNKESKIQQVESAYELIRVSAEEKCAMYPAMNPPSPPAMCSTSSKPVPPRRPVPPPIRVFRNEKHIRDEPVTVQNSGLSATDIIVGALVLDYLTPDTVETPKPEPAIESGGGSFGGGGASTSWDDTPSSTQDYGSSSRDSDYGWSSSSSSSDYSSDSSSSGSD